jgi:serine/threonine protein kinase
MDPLRAGDPSQVGDYRLLGRLGAGGMGQVYLGATPGGRLVAVKVIRAEITEDQEYRRRFAREVEAARSVGGFHTAHVVDADPDAASPWMVTAFVAGPSLQATVRQNGPLPVAAATALGAALAEGLMAIHRCGLVHRDLKPGNIIMAADGPRIIDFGIARPVGGSTLTERGTLVGTYSFMSPEQFRGGPVTPSSDVFALGCVLAFAATGRAPFDGETAHQVMYRVLEAAPDLGEVADGPFRAVTEQCLAKDPGQRPFLSGVLAAFGPAGPAPVPAASPLPAILLPAEAALPGEAGLPGEGAAQEPPENNENVTIAQVANASPGSVVIQVAGNAKIGDGALHY